jgi:hypothetical protein
MPPMNPACYGDGGQGAFSIPLARRVIGLEPVPAMLAHRQAAAPRASLLLTTAASRLFTSAGTRATSAAGPLARLWRDVNAAAVHPALPPQPAASEWAARALGS